MLIRCYTRKTREQTAYERCETNQKHTRYMSSTKWQTRPRKNDENSTWALAAKWANTLEANGAASFDLRTMRVANNDSSSVSTAALTCSAFDK